MKAKAPRWYFPLEMKHWLQRHNYSPEIASELCEQYAANLQKAFNKGFELGQREAARQRLMKVGWRNAGGGSA